jgi:hypothetical protein
MNEVYVLTHEYSDKSSFSICGVTEDVNIARTWIQGGPENHIYKIPLNQILPTHPRSNGWSEWHLE